MATKKQLQTKLKDAGIEFKSRATKDELEALLADATPKRTAPAKSKTTRGPSTKDVIRSLFPKTGVSITKVKLLEELPHVKETTVVTMIGDLKNPKYCGQQGPVVIEREGEEFTRTA